MIRVNLLPLAERQSKWPVDKLLVGAGFLVLLLFTSIYSYSLFQVWSMEKQIQTATNQYQALEPTRLLMVNATAKQQEFDKKNTIIVSLTNERQSWYGIIQHLATQSSAQIWFTDLVKTDKGTIQIKGWSTTYPLVAEFMKTLENDPFFTEPILNSVEKENATQTTKFDIIVKPKGI